MENKSKSPTTKDIPELLRFMFQSQNIKFDQINHLLTKIFQRLEQMEVGKDYYPSEPKQFDMEQYRENVTKQANERFDNIRQSYGPQTSK